MKRTGFKRPTYEAPPAPPIRPVPAELRARITMPRCEQTAKPEPKEGAWRSEAYRREIAGMPCSACGAPPPTQAAHANHRGKGMGMKCSDIFCFPLCPPCHAEFDQGKNYTRDQRRALADDWTLNAIAKLANAGRIKLA
jgi:hypothetical protein